MSALQVARVLTLSILLTVWDELEHDVRKKLQMANERLLKAGRKEIPLTEPVNAIAVALALGIDVKISLRPHQFPARLERRWDAKLGRFRWVIFVQPHQHPALRQRLVAHELGELLARLRGLQCPNIERYCDLVGDCIRCPNPALIKRLHNFDWQEEVLRELSAEFGIPVRSMFFRLAFYYRRPAALVIGSEIYRIGHWSVPQSDLFIRRAAKGGDGAKHFRLSDGAVAVIPIVDDSFAEMQMNFFG